MSKPRTPGITYPLRDVPKAVWHRAQKRAALEGRTMRYVIIALLEQWAEGGSSTARKARRK